MMLSSSTVSRSGPLARCVPSSRPCVSARQVSGSTQVRQQQGRLRAVCQVVRAEPEGEKRPPRNTEFGYSRKDVILIGAGMLGLGYAIYYGLQYFLQIEPLMAGNFTQLIIFVGLCFGWVGSYISRVANKKMTYVTQLEDYETAVMKKRLEEMTEEEYERTLKDGEK